MTSKNNLDESFKNSTTSELMKRGTEFEECEFINCDFSNDFLTSFIFIDCRFIDCNFSNTVMNNTSLKDVEFINCKLTGADLSCSNPFLLEMKFNSSELALANFQKLPLANSNFDNCNLTEVDFSATNLSGASFPNCNLDRAIFDQSNLEKTNFSSAYNITLDPDNNRLKGAKFSKESLPGLLNKYAIIVT